MVSSIDFYFVFWFPLEKHSLVVWFEAVDKGYLYFGFKHLTRDIHTVNLPGYKAYNCSWFLLACNRDQFMDVIGVENNQCHCVGLSAVGFPFLL